MRIPNLTLRGSIYWWRRRISLGGGQKISLAISLRTGVFNQARVRAGLLSAEVEKLRMAYGERGTAVAPATLKKIFSDALRWQLERIETDQLASSAHPEQHLWVNRAMAEMWRIFARPDQRWLAEDDERLAALGWTVQQRLLVADLWEEHRHQTMVSSKQIDAYVGKFEIARTDSNLDRVRRAIYGARAEACDEAGRRLEAHPAGYDGWAAHAMGDSSPFAFEAGSAEPVEPPVVAEHNPTENATPAETRAPTTAQMAGEPSGMSLTEAAETTIRWHVQQEAWSDDTIKQVRTAIRLFDFACGGNVAIENLTQAHVDAFYELCRELPNRWGKTKDEIARGIPASLDYARKLREQGDGIKVGFGPPTIAKHVTWIGAVLHHVDDEGALTGVRPRIQLRLKPKKQRIGAKKLAKKVRERDKRANWTRQEIARLLEAPVFHGSAGIDDRFVVGSEVIHDAWYWLPLMFILYGGRSAELTGLPLSDVHEEAPIPYFQVDYSDLRALKNAQSVRRLPVHPELIRLGFLEYARSMRELGHGLLFPEMQSPNHKSFATTFYRSVFKHWRAWAFPHGTDWGRQVKGAWKDKDVHSFRGVATSLMKNKVADSVRFDILGHEGENTTTKIYDDEAELAEKLRALSLLTSLTSHLSAHSLTLRPRDRQKFGSRRGRPKRLKIS